MNKTEFIQAVATEAGISKTLMDKIFACQESVIAKTIKKGKDQINITNFGTFKATKYASREMPSPVEGVDEMITIPAGYRITFKPGKGLKDTVNGKNGKAKGEVAEKTNKKADKKAADKKATKKAKKVVEDDEEEDEAPVAKKSKKSGIKNKKRK